MQKPTSNTEVSEKLNLLADLLEIRGESAFRVGAYRRAAEGITRLSEPLEGIRRHGELQSLSGVGGSIALKIEELLDTGTMFQLE
jgi:DNA polymerase (family X)